MKRIVIGAVTALSVWFGSALAAEAQQITPTGPMVIQTGTSLWTYTASVYIPTPANFKVITTVTLNGVDQCSFSQLVPNPGTTTYNLIQSCQVYFNISTTDVVTFKSQLCYNRNIYNAQPQIPQIVGTRPSSKSVQKKSLLALQSIDRDRRRE